MKLSWALRLLVVAAPSAVAAQMRVELPERSSIERRLSVDSAPSWEVGGTLDDPNLEFDHRNGLLGAAYSASGRLAVFDGHRIQVFLRANGAPMLVGRRGSGPGEFRSLSAGCFTRGDTLVAYDFGLRRVSVVSGDGKVVRQFGVSEYLPMWGDACTDDGTFAMQEVVSPEGADLRARIVLLNTNGERVRAFGNFATALGLLVASVSGSGSQILVGNPAEQSIRQYSQLGAIQRHLVLSDAPEPLAAADASRFGLSPRRGTTAPPPGRAASVPSSWPFFGTILKDIVGRVWIERFRRRSGEDSEWLVLTEDASPFAVVRIPRSLSSAPHPILISADQDGVILLRRDEDGAARIGWYRLVPDDARGK